MYLYCLYGSIELLSTDHLTPSQAFAAPLPARHDGHVRGERHCLEAAEHLLVLRVRDVAVARHDDVHRVGHRQQLAGDGQLEAVGHLRPSRASRYSSCIYRTL